MHRHSFTLLGIVIGLFLTVGASAQDDNPSQNQNNDSGICRFIDEDGDGFNDLAPDADGDGIPNGLDPDFIKPENGEGQQHQWKLVNGFFAKMFGFSLMGEMSGNNFGTDEDNSMHAGPGTGTGFGPGAASATGVGMGENQADHAGRRGGRR